MLLNKELYGSIAHEVARSPQLRMLYDLCDSENEDSQCMIKFLLPGTKSAILPHPKLLCVFMALPLGASLMSRILRRKWKSFKLASTMYEIVNKQVKFLTSQYIGTCKSAYTKGDALN